MTSVKETSKDPEKRVIRVSSTDVRAARLLVLTSEKLPVTDSAQTEEFFAAAIGQYDGVTRAGPEVTVIAETGHSLWADVT